MKDLQGKAVLITGVSSGIGWATARAFAQRKCRVALAARRIEKVKELSEMLKKSGTETLELSCDVRDERQATEAVEATVKRWGRIDVLVNNAGILENKLFEEQFFQTIEDMMKTNYMGPVYTMHVAIKHMRTQKEGHIVNVASIAGLMGIPYISAYCATKFALVGLTESLRRELYGSGITLTSFCPGLVDTPMGAPASGNSKSYRNMRIKSPEEVAEMIVWSAIHRAPEVIYGEVPGFLVKLSKLFPKLTDWAAYRSVQKMRQS